MDKGLLVVSILGGVYLVLFFVGLVYALLKAVANRDDMDGTRG